MENVIYVYADPVTGCSICDESDANYFYTYYAIDDYEEAERLLTDCTGPIILVCSAEVYQKIYENFHVTSR